MLVAVPAYHLGAGRVARWGGGAFAVPDKYVRALRRAGLRPVLVPGPAPDDPEELLSPFAGLFLAGGGDVDPERYGADPHPETYGLDADRDDLEFALFPAALHLGLPTLAVCRGMHVLNVALGGTLHQHLPDIEGQAAHGDPTTGMAVLHPVEVAEGSRLATAVGGTRLRNCSSHHHQTVADVASGLVPVAWSDDGLVEGLEPPAGAPWVVAVQWHPEENVAEEPGQQRIFDAFAHQVRERSDGTRSP